MGSQLTDRYIPMAIVLVIALTFHEFAHAWSAHYLGDDTAYDEGRVTLNPLAHLDFLGSVCFLFTGFGWAKPVPVNILRLSKPRRDDFIVSAAGPMANIALALLSSGILRTLVYLNIFQGKQDIPLLQLLFIVLHFMVLYNIMLALFNLIPIGPLDGSHMMANFLEKKQSIIFREYNDAYGTWMLLIFLLLPRMTNGTIDPFEWILSPPIRFFYQLLTP